MGRKAIDMTGHRYGRLTVIGRGEDHVYPSGRRRPRWQCVCDCGAAVTVLGLSLRSGNTRSCGCLFREKSAERCRQRTGEANPMYGKTGEDHPMYGRTGEANPMYGKTGEASPAWKGNTIGYAAAHQRIRRAKGSASLHPCTDCSASAVDWSYEGFCANERRDPKHGAYCAGAHMECYEPRCKPCHRAYDAALAERRSALVP